MSRPVASRAATRPRAVVRLLAFSLLVTAAFFLVLEGIFRMVGVEPPRERPRILLDTQDIDITFPFMQPDPELFWSLTPGFRGSFLGTSVSINALGLRGPNFSRPKPTVRHRIACFGDSITFGYGVDDDETYPYLLGRALSRQGVEVINAGVTGYTTHQVLRLLQRVGPTLDVDVATFLVGWNDATERPLSDREYQRRLHAGLIARSMLDDSYLFRALRGYYQRRELAAPPSPGTKPRVSLAEYRENLASIAQECREHGIQPVLIALPRRRGPGERAFHSPYRETLREEALRLEVPLLECGELGLHGSPESNEQYFLDLLHFNAAGNERMARELAVQLVELSLR